MLERISRNWNFNGVLLGKQNCATTLENNCHFLTGLNICQTYDSAILLLDKYLINEKSAHTKTCILMFIAALFITVHHWNHPIIYQHLKELWSSNNGTLCNKKGYVLLIHSLDTLYNLDQSQNICAESFRFLDPIPTYVCLGVGGVPTQHQAILGHQQDV